MEVDCIKAPGLREETEDCTVLLLRSVQLSVVEA